MPGRALELLRSEIEDDGHDGTFREIWAILLGFSRLGEFIGEGGTSGAKWGPHALLGAGPTWATPSYGVGPWGTPQGPLRTPGSPRFFIYGVIDFVRF